MDIKCYFCGKEAEWLSLRDKPDGEVVLYVPFDWKVINGRWACPNCAAPDTPDRKVPNLPDWHKK